MKTLIKRLISASLALVMVVSLSCVALAIDSNTKPNEGNDIVASNTTSNVSTDVKVTFVAGDNYELTAAPGTITEKDGSVTVTLSTKKIPGKLVPQIDGADKYYEIKGWAIKNAYGELEEIDLAEYTFTKSKTEVYPIVADIWVPYIDMKQDRSDWFYEYVRDLSVAGVIGGYTDNTFRQAGNVTWGEALKLIMLATGYQEQKPVDSHWASGYLAKALADGLVTAEQNIVLNDPITRLEYAHVAAKAMKLPAAEIESPFADTDDGAVLALYSAKIVEGSFNSSQERVYLPESNITRAELSAVIWRINNYYRENAAE